MHTNKHTDIHTHTQAASAAILFIQNFERRSTALQVDIYIHTYIHIHTYTYIQAASVAELFIQDFERRATALKADFDPSYISKCVWACAKWSPEHGHVAVRAVKSYLDRREYICVCVCMYTNVCICMYTYVFICMYLCKMDP